MLTIQVEKISKVALLTLQAAVKRVVREKRTTATSLGVLFDFRFGTMSIALNDDDDESFRCPYFEYFQHQNWATSEFDDLVDLDDKLNRSESDVDNVLLNDHGEQAKLGTIEDVCRALYPKSIQWLTEWFHTQPTRQWQPIWLRIEEATAGGGETVKISAVRKPPRRRIDEEEPPILRGLPPPKNGAKVFVISHCRARKYAGLWPIHEREALGPWFIGKPLTGEYDSSVHVKLDPEGVRRGDFAKFESSFAYLDSGSKAAEITKHLDSEPHIESFQLFDGEQNWTAIHPLNPVSVLDTSRTLFDWQPDKQVFENVRIAEFDPEALRSSGRSIFKLVESPYLGPFFFEDDLKPGFLAHIEKLGLRGLIFDMVWCEDLSEVIPHFEEFMNLLKYRLKRKIGTISIRDWYDVDCLYGVQKDFARIGFFRETFNKDGAEVALKQHPGISVLIRSLIPYAPFQYPASKQPITKEVILEVEARFEGKEILNEVRGRFCHQFSNAFSSLKEMESSGR